MKALLGVVLCLVALSVMAGAAPRLFLMTTIEERDERGEKVVVGKPNVIAESGKRAVITRGEMEWRVTPILGEDGTVDLRVVVVDLSGKKPRKLATKVMSGKLGEDVSFDVGDLTFTANPALTK